MEGKVVIRLHFESYESDRIWTRINLLSMSCENIIQYQVVYQLGQTLLFHETITPSAFGWAYSSRVWHSFAVVVNLLHAAVLRRMPDLRFKPNGKVLLAITFSDIYFSAVKIVFDSHIYDYREAVELYVRLLKDTSLHSSIYLRY